jgi:hypothetical protein
MPITAPSVANGRACTVSTTESAALSRIWLEARVSFEAVSLAVSV